MSLYVAVPLASSVAYLGLFILVVGWGRTRASRWYAVALAVSFLWGFASFMLRADLATEYAWVFGKILFFASFAVAPAYYRFVRAFGNRGPDLSVYAGYLVVAAAAVAAVGGPFPLGEGNSIWPEGNGLVLTLAIATGLTFALLSLGVLARQYQRLRDPQARTRTQYLLIGTSFVVVFAALEANADLANLSVSHFGALINAGVTSYAVLRHRLLEIKVVVRRTLAVSVVTVLMSALYLGLLGALDEALASDLTVTRAFAACVTVGIGVIVLGPLTERAQEVIDRIFLGAAYASRNLNDGPRAIAGETLDVEGMARSLLQLVVRAVGATDAALILPEESGGEYLATVTLKEGTMFRDFRVRSTSPLLSYLSREGEPVFRRDLDRVPDARALWQHDTKMLDAAGVELLCPVRAKNSLMGVLALGSKYGNYSYTSSDLAVLTSAAAEVGTLLESARRHLDIQVQANTDELTGLFNHRLFYQTMEEQIRRASRFGSTFSLVMVDLDLFKTYNDTHGHTAGDTILREVGQCIATSVRNIDAAFRYGGEEFAIILPDAKAEQGLKVAERLRRNVEARMDTRGIWLTVSAGVASWPADAVIGSELVRCADAALYESKRRGRNCSTLYSRLRPGADSRPNQVVRPDDGVSMVYALAATVDAKDHFTYGHSKKVSKYAVAIGEAMGLPETKIAVLRHSGLLHDIGKISVPDALLRKQGPLVQLEWDQMRGHPEVAVAILRHVEGLAECLPAILHHHERWDGSGYPLGLEGQKIPLEARIVAVADSYDAMTSDRPYRKALPPERALDELVLCAGRQFDPEVVQSFADLIESSSSHLTRIHAEMARA